MSVVKFFLPVCFLLLLTGTTLDKLNGQCTAFSDGFESGDVSAWTSVFPFDDPTSKNSNKANGAYSVVSSLVSDPGFTEITPLTGNFFADVFGNGGTFSTGLTADVMIPDTATSAMLMWNDWWAYSLSGATGTDISVRIRVRQGTTTVENEISVDGSGGASEPGTGWVAKSLDLTPYIGTTVSITFLVSSSATSGYSFQYGLDDVKVALSPCPSTDPAPEIVPTLGEWSVIILALIMGIFLIIGYRKLGSEVCTTI